MYNLSVNKLPESLIPAVGGGIIDYESPNLDYAYNSVFESESDIHNYRIMPTQIKESMVLWYDISRQGCTNENMSENPVLRDLSGNGHDATCSGFAWTENDGISTINYPNAIVSDSDSNLNSFIYFNTRNTSIISKQYGYTIITKRKCLENNNSTTFASSVYTSYDENKYGTFMFEDMTSTKKRSMSFSGYTILSDFEKSDISYQTSTSYNGIQITPSENYKDGANFRLNLFRSYTNIDGYYGKFAMWSFLLFNRDLTAEEIEWVKRNLV